ncbi:MAG: hypothetical protein M5U28_28690 [Sandaracinaceae bacterium]|nr:hypothetical protein [Sandaracinaceae bacterium]
MPRVGARVDRAEHRARAAHREALAREVGADLRVGHLCQRARA